MKPVPFSLLVALVLSYSTVFADKATQPPGLVASDVGSSRRPTQCKGAQPDSLPITSATGTTEGRLFSTSSMSFAVPETREVLKIKRPFLRLSGNIIVVRVTDDEWSKLLDAYPAENLQNADSSTDLVFMGPSRK